jgi:hypothetical protein
MIQSKTLFAAIAIAAAAGSVGFVAATFNGSARAAAGQIDANVVAERIGGAFALVDAVEAGQQIRSAAVRVAKGDLPVSLRCSGQTWPNVGHGCLVTTDGSPAPRVRYITVDSQTGEAETVLLRIPASLIASR